MYFYKRFYVLSFILNYHITTSIKNKKLRYTSGLDSIVPCSVGLQFFTEINNTSNDDFSIELNPDLCCLELPDGEDCNVMEIGGCTSFIAKGSTKTLKLVAPILDPYERKGYCIVYIDSKPIQGPRIFMRDTLKIPFDTRVKGYLEDVKKCKEVDEDPQNDCKPVDCDTYYNGKRSFFNSRTKKCTKISKCINKNDPSVIYDPASNKCIKKKSIDIDDIDFIKSLNSGRDRQPKDILIIKSFKNKNKLNPKITKINDKDDVIFNLKKGETYPFKENATKTKEQNKSVCPVIKYFINYKYSIIMLGIVVIIQCCLICTLFYCMSYTCLCCKQKKVVRKFFNHRQDASITTPLIYTSNIDTDTTEFPYLSESSINVNKKIKWYKSCQKERKDDVKMSMSDDILSKCLNRRDWERKPVSETKQLDKNDRVDIIEIKNAECKSISEIDRKYTETKVNYENEKENEVKNEVVKSIEKDIEKKFSDDIKSEFSGVQCDLSEKEIRCHSYNYMGASVCGSNATGFKPSVQSKTYSMSKTERSKKGTISVSSEKGAQACFSNDSIDDFLSERGMIFLSENGSKYTFSSTPEKSSNTSVSSRTSKRNIVKKIVSLFSRKSKHGPSSDPGLKKSKDNLDLELLHMSHATIYSSSNNGSDFVKGFKRVKDSRTSL